MSSKSLFRHLVSAGLLVSGGILLGRITGFLRDVAVAARFGVSQEADIVLFSLTLPDFLINLLMGGAFAAALIPEFKRSTPKTADQLFLQSSLLAGSGFLLLVAVLVWNADHLIHLFAPGFDPASVQTTEHLLTIVLWLMPLTALAGITMSYLQSKNHFAVPALGTFIFNTTLIIALFFFVVDAGDFKVLGAAVLIGGLLRWISQLICMGTQGMQWTRPEGWLISKDLFWRYFQALAAGSLLLVLPVIARALASLAGPGGFASMNYSIKLIELPMGVCLGVLASVLFPKLSEFFAQDRSEEGEQLATDGVLWVFIIAYTVVLVFICFGQPLTRLAFQWGAMPAEGIQDIVLLVVIGITALPAQGILLLMTALANAKQDTRLPFYCSLVGVIVFVPLSGFLFQRNGLQGIMMALVASYWLILAAQIILLHHRHRLSIIKLRTLIEISKVMVTGFLLLLPFIWIARTIQVPLMGSLGLAVGAGALMLAGGFLVIKRYRNYIIHRLGLRTHA
jgi:putative peptidoglycan lipid II flippase